MNNLKASAEDEAREALEESIIEHQSGTDNNVAVNDAIDFLLQARTERIIELIRQLAKQPPLGHDARRWILLVAQEIEQGGDFLPLPEAQPARLPESAAPVVRFCSSCHAQHIEKSSLCLGCTVMATHRGEPKDPC